MDVDRSCGSHAEAMFGQKGEECNHPLPIMAEEVRNNIRDPKLKDGVLPDFTATTTPEDRTVAGCRGTLSTFSIVLRVG